MFILVRTMTYSTLFIGLFLIFGPARVLASAGVRAPAAIGPFESAGIVIGVGGAIVCVACIAVFVTIGKGTPMPLDPPRRLVAAGPYRRVRNPMYLGAAVVMVGAAMFYRSLALLGYASIFLALLHVFVVLYEEPTLERTFGDDYRAYCRCVSRWWPNLRCRPSGC